MKVADALSSLPKTAVLLSLLLLCFLLLSGMLYRSLMHMEMAIGSIADPAMTGRLIERLELLDADYRVRKDGRILVDEGDAARLQRQGLALGEVRPQPDRRAQALLILLLLATAGAVASVARRVARLLQPSNPAPAVTEPHAGTPTAPQLPVTAPEAPFPAETQRLYEGEHPQTVAVYLLTLATAEAAAAMEAMEVQQRDRVWERMACSGECDEGLRRRLSELFARKMKALQKRVRPAETTEKMVAIYRRLTPQTREALLAALRRGHPKERIIRLLEAEALQSHRRGEG